MRRPVSLLVSAMLLAACANRAAPTSSAQDSSTSCHEVIPECNVDRLPDRVLTGSETDGALRSADGFDLTGIISFDDALKLGWREGTPADPKGVQVVLGSADADKLHWGRGTHLYYAIVWNGLCLTGDGPPGPSGAPPPSPQCDRSWASIFDARTGAFVVEGTSGAVPFEGT